MIRRLLAALCLASGGVMAAETPVAALSLVAEYPVSGLVGGNLSGLAWCDGALYAVSDREDDRIYRLELVDGELQAQPEIFELPEPRASGLPWGMRVRTQVAGQFRGGQMDFEGLSCDNLGNRYLVSEAHVGVLKVSPAGSADWLGMPASLVRQARASGMLLKHNAMFEGLAVDAEGQRLWLAAERERRGLLVIHLRQSSWQCTGGCVLLAEGGRAVPPASVSDSSQPVAFAGLAFHGGKLFTLERATYQICRRDPANGTADRCWSYAQEALVEGRRYNNPFGSAEGLWVDAEGAWIGVDNNGQARADGEARPIVWRFAAPKGGWGARP